MTLIPSRERLVALKMTMAYVLNVTFAEMGADQNESFATRLLKRAVSSIEQDPQGRES